MENKSALKVRVQKLGTTLSNMVIDRKSVV